MEKTEKMSGEILYKCRRDSKVEKFVVLLTFYSDKFWEKIMEKFKLETFP